MSDLAALPPEPAPAPSPSPEAGDAGPAPAASRRTTPSMLAYAFAHKIAPPPAKLMPAKPVPCAGPDVKVSRDDLAVIMLHVALWDLERRGLVQFEDVEKKVLFVKQRQLKVRVAPDAAPEAEVKDSLEFAILAAAIRGHGDADVRGVVRGLYPGDVEEPYRRAVAMGNAALIDAGFVRLDVEERSGLGRLRGGRKETLMWQCDRLNTLVPAFNAFVDDWVRDREAKRALYDRLHKEIDRAIASRKKEERDSLLETLSDD